MDTSIAEQALPKIWVKGRGVPPQAGTFFDGWYLTDGRAARDHDGRRLPEMQKTTTDRLAEGLFELRGYGMNDLLTHNLYDTIIRSAQEGFPQCMLS